MDHNDAPTCFPCVKEIWQRDTQVRWQRKRLPEVPKSSPAVLPAHLQTIQLAQGKPTTLLEFIASVIQEFQQLRSPLTMSNPATTSGKSFCSWMASFTAALTSDKPRALKEAAAIMHTNMRIIFDWRSRIHRQKKTTVQFYLKVYIMRCLMWMFSRFLST